MSVNCTHISIVSIYFHCFLPLLSSVLVHLSVSQLQVYHFTRSISEQKARAGHHEWIDFRSLFSFLFFPVIVSGPFVNWSLASVSLYSQHCRAEIYGHHEWIDLVHFHSCFLLLLSSFLVHLSVGQWQVYPCVPTIL